MRYRHDAKLFIEVATEYGLLEVTTEDAVLECPAYPDMGPGRRDDRASDRCLTAVLYMVRPGRWDRW